MHALPPLRSVLVIGMLAFGSTSIPAASVTFNFTGLTIGFNSQGGLVPDVPLGTPIFGSFSFETLEAPLVAGATTTYFALTRFTLEVPAVPQYSFSVDRPANAYANFARSVENLAEFSANNSANSNFGYFRIAMPLVYTGEEMLAQLTSETSKLQTGSFSHTPGNSAWGTGTYQATSLTQAPEPTATVLLGMAATGLLTFGRRRSARRVESGA